MSQGNRSFEAEDLESPFLNEFFSKTSIRKQERYVPTMVSESPFLEASAIAIGEFKERGSFNPPNETCIRVQDANRSAEFEEQPETDSIDIEHFAISLKPIAGAAALLPPPVPQAVGLYILAADDAVHEDISRRAARFAGVPYDRRLENGCRWPDVPCSRKTRTGGEEPDDDTVATCYDNFLKYFVTKTSGTIPYRSHQGDFQIWHSMSLTGEGTNLQVRDRILKQIGEWYEKGRFDAKTGLFHIGKALHTIQDSYSQAHTWRAESNKEEPASPQQRPPLKGEIRSFQDFNAQNGQEHRKADKKSSPGYQDALVVSIVILKFFKKKEPFYPKVYNFLLNRVFVLAPGYDSLPAGGSHHKFKKTEKVKREVSEGEAHEAALEGYGGVSSAEEEGKEEKDDWGEKEYLEQEEKADAWGKESGVKEGEESQEWTGELKGEQEEPEDLEALVAEVNPFQETERTSSPSASVEPPKGLVLLNHVHIPRQPDPKHPGVFFSAAAAKLEPKAMNPGFIDANDELLTDTTSTGLQTCLKKLITTKYGDFLTRACRQSGTVSKDDRVHIALVDLTGPKLTQLDFAGWGSTVPMYGASVPKILALYGAHQLRSDLRHMAKDVGISRGLDLEEAVIQSWKAKGLMKGFPDIVWLFDIRKWSGVPESLNFSTAARNVCREIMHNCPAGELIVRVGFPYIASTAWQSGLWHPVRGGLWLRSSYCNKGNWGSNPVSRPMPVYGHNVTALSAATYFTLLAQDRLVDDTTSAEMKNWLKGGCTTSLFPKGIGVVASKCGLYSKYVHDCALIERSDIRYVIVVLTELRSKETSKYTELCQDLDALVVKNNQHPK